MTDIYGNIYNNIAGIWSKRRQWNYAIYYLDDNSVRIVFMVYRKSKLVRNLTLLHSMRNNGPNSLATIGALDNVVRDMLKSDGVTVSDLKIVHEIGNRYNAILTAGGKTYDMSITADKAGNVQYRIN